MQHASSERAPNTAVSYVRCSTTRQDLSPEVQREAIRVFAKRSGLEVIAEHHDLGVSGATELAERPGLLAALRDLRGTGSQTLLVAKRDRLGRDVAVVAIIEREVEKHGARVLCADGTANGEGGHAAFMRTILDAVAQLERHMIRDRIAAALDVRRSAGKVTGPPPLGFELAQDGDHLVESRREQRAARLARRLRSNESLSLRAIAERLDEAGVRTRTGRPWHPQQVSRLLSVPSLRRRTSSHRS